MNVAPRSTPFTIQSCHYARPMRLLTVCTHNRTRSVLMAGLLWQRFHHAGVEAEVESAGFGPPNLPPTPETVDLLFRTGVDSRRHSSLLATRALVAPADLVLTAERQHVVRLVAEEGGNFQRIFTLPEFCQRLGSLGTARFASLDAALAVLNDGRPRGGAYLQADVPEVFDPTGGPPDEWTTAFATISTECARAADFLLSLGS